jgi:hypothetical protein
MKFRCLQLALLLAACGCRMGQDPYDYSGPVQGSPSIPYPATTTRSGSISTNGPMATSPNAAPNVPQPQTTPQLNPQRTPSDTITRQPATSTMRR